MQIKLLLRLAKWAMYSTTAYTKLTMQFILCILEIQYLLGYKYL